MFKNRNAKRQNKRYRKLRTEEFLKYVDKSRNKNIFTPENNISYSKSNYKIAIILY